MWTETSFSPLTSQTRRSTPISPMGVVLRTPVGCRQTADRGPFREPAGSATLPNAGAAGFLKASNYETGDGGEEAVQEEVRYLLPCEFRYLNPVYLYRPVLVLYP